MNVNIRKCKYCGKDIDVDKEEFIKYSNAFYHANCFIERQLNKKRGAWTLEQCHEELNKFKEFEQKKTHEKFVKDSLIEFLTNQYNISFFPNYFYVKMQSIYNGTYKGLQKPIPPEHLLEMWETKINYLNKINAKKDIPLEGLNRINYDLAILLARYDKFIKWKETQKQEQEQIQLRIKEKNNMIQYKILTQSQHRQCSDDLSDMLDEI